ncbi:MAG: 16S rRNA (uracil(1498)-N(3))-methyltransferase [Legionellales bacterium]|nr:16S rRNA (uracil(1498)-N(3))-methyltransferase [Legionellales bacterium]
MPAGRIYQDTELAIDQLLSLTEAASHYLMRVLRVQSGDGVVIFNGTGGEYQATIEALSKRCVTVRLVEFHHVDSESPLELELGQSLLRGDKMDWVIQKAVELGVSVITPLLTERVTVKLQPDRLQKRLHHWQGVAISACEQSGRCVVPVVRCPVDVSVWVKSSKTPGFIASPQAEGSLPKTINSTQARVLIGPEGGLSSKDIEHCQSDVWYQFSMGPRILRTETAAISVMTIMQMQWGDLH